jgi:hypothetical protein
MTDSRHAQLRAALKRAASVLAESGPPFALGGSYALWAHGAPEPVNDVDLVVSEPDTEQAAAALADAGFEVERTPEDWLFKAHTGEVTVDVLHRPDGHRVDAAVLARATQLDVFGVRMPVLPPTEVFLVKLRSLSEHHCDFAALLPAARAIRERLDWSSIERQSADNDFACAFLVLARRLGIYGDA